MSTSPWFSLGEAVKEFSDPAAWTRLVEAGEKAIRLELISHILDRDVISRDDYDEPHIREAGEAWRSALAAVIGPFNRKVRNGDLRWRAYINTPTDREPGPTELMGSEWGALGFIDFTRSIATGLGRNYGGIEVSNGKEQGPETDIEIKQRTPRASASVDNMSGEHGDTMTMLQQCINFLKTKKAEGVRLKKDLHPAAINEIGGLTDNLFNTAYKQVFKSKRGRPRNSAG